MALLLAGQSVGTSRAIAFAEDQAVTSGAGDAQSPVFRSDKLQWQEFVPTIDNIKWVELNLSDGGGTLPDIIVQIRNADGSVILGSKTFPSGGYSAGWNLITFDTEISLIPSETYRIYVLSDSSSGLPNAYRWKGHEDSGYNCCLSSKHVDNGNSSELWYRFDFHFKTYGLYSSTIFFDSFESGNLSAWSSKKGASITEYGALGCNLCVVKKGALENVYSLKVKIPNRKPHYVQDNNPAAETEYHALFKIKRGKTLKMGKLNKFKVLLAKNGTQTPFFIQVRRKGTKYQIGVVAKLDDGSKTAPMWTNLPRKATWIEIDWQASDGGNNGHVKLYKNNELKLEQIGLENDTFAIDLVRFGVAARIKSAYTISGAFKLDYFVSDRGRYIDP